MFEKYFGKIMLGIILFVSIIFWCFISFKTSLLFIGSFTLMMFINISFTSLCNALVGKEVPSEGDAFWKILFMFITCVCYSLFFTI